MSYFFSSSVFRVSQAVNRMVLLRTANPDRAVDLTYIERAVEQLVEVRVIYACNICV